ncbi:hypothetical protein AMC82_PD00897 (plasmid) [Rhizobium phaseoli]|uniref:DUF1254 domain-containing protein n=1 Tax=Rhizobium phaseoli TaxID=396 RepID=UPI0007EC11DA|nr:DUF1254 domain-containing protein [Rhizobium phaseoli]ANL69859.1 hypothetical protein AMC84_PD00901 [Rhizobium phaseoli]ANL76294.1 hypothetical protein AMC83_PE00886 [Rhizobium phaseoli]ANL82651.1 hypothetical protein AMC82_PD00897 [Rhizobium phaseoli]PDS69794.1 hypothetical protein CO651_21445 [Rhizobium phaseoli]
MIYRTLISGLAFALAAAPALADVSGETVKSLSAPETIETQAGKLDFRDGVPTEETAQKVYDALDFTNALNVYNNSFRGASALAIAKGMDEIGAKAGDIVIFSELMDANSLFLTANADTVYYFTALELSKGPVVIEQPSNAVGTINDMWFSWVIDIGGPGPDRGLGGKYLIVGPDYDGPLPEGGYFVARAKTNFALYAARAYMVDNDPKPAVENIKRTMKIYPYEAGSFGSSIAQALEGKVRIAGEPKIPEMKFIEASHRAFNTIPPSDFGFFEMINENVQNQPATSYDVELAGQLAAIGIVHGKPFKPDERMKKILSDAAAVGQATGRALNWRFAMKHPDWAYYEGTHWGNMLFEGGAFFETPPPLFEKGIFKPLPPTGARTLDSRAAFYYGYTLDSPGMIMRIPGVGSQYLMGFLDAEGEPFDGGKTYKVTLPKDIPAKAFWSFTLYDNQTRSMLQTQQKYPRAGSQSYPSPAAEAASDGTTTVYFGSDKPKGVARGNWIQTDPKKGWFTILRLYSPLPSFFDKSWRPSEIELVK